MAVLRVDGKVPPRCGQQAQATTGGEELREAGAGREGGSWPWRVRVGASVAWALTGPHPAHLGQGGCPHLHMRWANILYQKKELLRTLGGKRRQLIEIHGFFHRKAQEKYFGKE